VGRAGIPLGNHDGLGLMPTAIDPGPPLNEHSRAIIEIAARNDRESFSRLFLFFAPRLKAHLLRLGAEAALSEELVQETMLVVWRKAVHFDPARASASTWIFTIARNLWIDNLRRGRRKTEFADVPWDCAPPDEPGELLEQADSVRSVRNALASLPAEQRDVIRLSFFEGRAQSEIAERLSIPLGTVKSRIRLASARLRALLERSL